MTTHFEDADGCRVEPEAAAGLDLGWRRHEYLGFFMSISYPCQPQDRRTHRPNVDYVAFEVDD